MVTSDKSKSGKSNDKTDTRDGDQYANAAENDPNYTTDVHTLTESEADQAERERNEQLREEPVGAQGPHYNAHLDADGPGGITVANERTDGKDNPTYEERTGISVDDTPGRTASK